VNPDGTVPGGDSAERRTGSLPGESNGQAASLPHPSPQPAAEDRPPIFWRNPLAGEGDLVWLHALLRQTEPAARDTHALPLLEELREHIGPSRTGWLLKWLFCTRVGAASRELDQAVEAANRRLEETNRRRAVEREAVGAEIAAVTARRNETREALAVEEAAYGRAVGEAGLSCEPHPQRLEQALRESVPRREVVAGGHEMLSAEPERSSRGAQLRAGGASLMAGAMLGLCLGTLLGLISLVDLQRNDRGPQLLAAALVGWALVWLLGESVAHAARFVARCKEPTTHQPSAFHRDWHVAAVVVGLAMMLGAAEITAEALGMRELQLQLMESRRRLGQETSLLPMGVYFLLGTLVSGPYLLYKLCRSWGESQQSLRQAQLAYRQQEWIEQKRSSAPVQEAFAYAHRVSQLRQRLEEIGGELSRLCAQQEALAPLVTYDEETWARVQSLAVTALAETEAFQARIESVLNDPEVAYERNGAGKEPGVVWGSGRAGVPLGGGGE
jgi:hypothetical protein